MPSADDLFPILVYCIMSANPPNLESNLEYIADYLSPDQKLNREGFVLTNLMAAVQFLKKIDSNALLKGELKLKQERRETNKSKWAQKMDVIKFEENTETLTNTQERESIQTPEVSQQMQIKNLENIELKMDSSDSEKNNSPRSNSKGFSQIQEIGQANGDSGFMDDFTNNSLKST